MTESSLRAVVSQRRPNAILGWTILAFVTAVALGELIGGERVWGLSFWWSSPSRLSHPGRFVTRRRCFRGK
ncbi:hypothetical protein [Halobaculum halobium]|uniref:hypothetical protein n=1 Tax=Halobaculum halobium TaxID=3032281 RepID=UPI0036F2656B